MKVRQLVGGSAGAGTKNKPAETSRLCFLILASVTSCCIQLQDVESSFAVIGTVKGSVLKKAGSAAEQPRNLLVLTSAQDIFRGGQKATETL